MATKGHHAGKDTMMGFCLLNHIAIAAQFALEKKFAQKVAIIDWDVHPGNGTQEIFYDSSQVLVISLHRFDDMCFWPFLESSATQCVGDGDGKGKNINIAWNRNKSSQRPGDTEYLFAFHQVVLPVLKQFKPGLILVSAGFDATEGDPLGSYHVSVECFAELTQLLEQVCPNLALVLEGGYACTALSYCVFAVVDAMLNPEHVKLTDPLALQPTEDAIADVETVKEIHKQFWKLSQNE